MREMCLQRGKFMPRLQETQAPFFFFFVSRYVSCKLRVTLLHKIKILEAYTHTKHLLTGQIALNNWTRSVNLMSKMHMSDPSSFACEYDRCVVPGAQFPRQKECYIIRYRI